MKIKRKPVDILFDTFNVNFMAFVVVIMLYPFWYVMIGSVSSMGHMISGGFVLWPDGLNLTAYQQVFRDALVPTAYRNTIIVTAGGTAISMVLTILGAYVLSLKDLPGRSGVTMFFVFTMLFSGGLIPQYLVVNGIGMTNTLWALIIPGAISTYNMILMRNFFQSVPYSLYEAASIDGETMLGYMRHILLPLSGAAIATISLFYAVGYWNDYFKSIIYIRSRNLWPMQTLLREMMQASTLDSLLYDGMEDTLPSETLKYAMIVVAMLPILCVYPFVQKYFVKGVMVGSLKG